VGPRCFGSLLHRLVKFQGEVKGSADLTDDGQAGVRRDKPACWRVQGRSAYSVRKSLTSAKARVLLPFPHDSTTGAAHRSPFCMRWWAGTHSAGLFLGSARDLNPASRPRSGVVECPSSPRVRDGLSAGRLTTYYPYRSLSFLDCPIRLSRKTIFAPRSASSTCLEVCASELRARLKINQPRSSASVAPNGLCLS